MSSVYIMKHKDAELNLSSTPLQDPADILSQMPTQALSPALLELLDLLSSPIRLIQNTPAGEARERREPAVALRLAA